MDVLSVVPRGSGAVANSERASGDGTPEAAEGSSYDHPSATAATSAPIPHCSPVTPVIEDGARTTGTILAMLAEHPHLSGGLA